MTLQAQVNQSGILPCIPVGGLRAKRGNGLCTHSQNQLSDFPILKAGITRFNSIPNTELPSSWREWEECAGSFPGLHLGEERPWTQEPSGTWLRSASPVLGAGGGPQERGVGGGVQEAPLTACGLSR